MPIFSPYTGNVEVGTHSITIEKTGYNSYFGTVKICSQKLSRVKKTLTAVTTTTTTTQTTTVTTTTTTLAATTVTTSAATTSATTSAGTGATTAAASGTVIPAATGSLSLTTAPASAAVYIDGVQRGVSPAVIPGLAAGSHTVLLKLDGYLDLSAPVSITAGTMNEFSTGMTPLAAGATAVPVTTAAAVPPATPTKAQSPGFEAALGLVSLGTILYLRNGLYR